MELFRTDLFYTNFKYLPGDIYVCVLSTACRQERTPHLPKFYTVVVIVGVAHVPLHQDVSHVHSGDRIPVV